MRFSCMYGLQHVLHFGTLVETPTSQVIVCGNVGGEQGGFGQLQWTKCKETHANYMRGLLQSLWCIVRGHLDGFLLERHSRIVVFFSTCSHIFESPRMDSSQAFALLVHTVTPRCAGQFFVQTGPSHNFLSCSSRPARGPNYLVFHTSPASRTHKLAPWQPLLLDSSCKRSQL